MPYAALGVILAARFINVHPAEWEIEEKERRNLAQGKETRSRVVFDRYY